MLLCNNLAVSFGPKVLHAFFEKERSNLSQILGPARFLPSPVNFERNASGIKLVERDCDKEKCEWLSLPWRLALDALVSKQAEIDPVPFDLYCSTGHNVVERYCINVFCVVSIL